MSTSLSIDRTSIIFTTIVMGLMLSICAPQVSHAQGKPAVTGQARAATVGNNSTNNGNANANANSNGNTNANANANQSMDNSSSSTDTGTSYKAQGLERAATVVKRQEIQNQLTYILTLIRELQNAINGHGIGQELSAFIHNGRQIPNTNTGTTTTSSNLTASLVSSTETFIGNSTTTTADDQGQFVMTLNVTASTSDVTIPAVASTDAATTTGVVFSVMTASSTAASGTANAILSSNAATSTAGYVVASGTTATFTVTVTFTPATAGDYYVELNTINTDGGSLSLTPAANFSSGTLTI